MCGNVYQNPGPTSHASSHSDLNKNMNKIISLIIAIPESCGRNLKPNQEIYHSGESLTGTQRS